MKYCFLCILFLSSLFSNAQNADTSFKEYTQTVPGSSMKFKMVPIPGGKFLMGSANGEKDEAPQRNFFISPFWMGAYEVTHDEFDLFFQDAEFAENSKVDAVTRPTPQYIDLSWGMGKEGGFPANSMQQFTALMYCRWLYKKTGVFYRLPTEAEWEYAARAGSPASYFFGDDPKELPKYAWYKPNGKSVYHKVGLLQPNAWGLYDILGNVAEWTLDQYDENYFTKFPDGATDPKVEPTTIHPKTVRGGSFEDEAKDLRASNRRAWEASWNERDPQIPRSRWWLTDAAFVGFRLVRPLKQPTPAEADAFFKIHLQQ